MIGSPPNSMEYGAPRFQGVLGHLAVAPKRQVRARVIGFVGCRKGDGTTFVMNELARNLARGERHREVVTCVGGLVTAEKTFTEREVRDCCVATTDEGVWRLDLPSPALGADSCDSATPPLLAALSVEFDSVLLDLGAAATSGSVWRLAHHVDDLLLVVAAGETKRSQIASAQRILEQAGGRVSGCILNKRTYPLPRMLYRMLNE